MFVSVEIRGAAQTVRRRNGEEVSEPVTEQEEGLEPAAPVSVARVDLQRINRDGFLDVPRGSLEGRMEPQPDMRVVGSAAGTFTDKGWDDDDDEPPQSSHRERSERRSPTQGELLRLALSRPRRLLRRLHAESRRRGRVTVRFTRPLRTGRAIFEVTVDRGQVIASAKVEVARTVGGSLDAKAQHAKGLARFEIELEGSLRGNGDVENIRADWRVRDLDLAASEERQMERLGRTVARVADNKLDRAKARLTRVLGTWLKAHPMWALALMDRVLRDLGALALAPSVRQKRADRRRERGGPTFDDIVNGASEPATAELVLDAAPSVTLRWLDDRTPQFITSERPTWPEAEREWARLRCLVPVVLEGLG